MVIPIIYSKHYSITLEVVNFNKQLTTFIHATVNTWNTSIYKELKLQWTEFRKHYTDDIWALPPQENTAKFARLFGFKSRGIYMRHTV